MPYRKEVQVCKNSLGETYRFPKPFCTYGGEGMAKLLLGLIYPGLMIRFSNSQGRAWTHRFSRFTKQRGRRDAPANGYGLCWPSKRLEGDLQPRWPVAHCGDGCGTAEATPRGCKRMSDAQMARDLRDIEIVRQSKLHRN